MHEALLALRIGVVVVGAVVSLWALRLAVWARAHRAIYVSLTLGFALLTSGVVVESALFVAGWDLVDAHTVEAFTSAAGFLLILAAILRSSV